VLSLAILIKANQDFLDFGMNRIKVFVGSEILTSCGSCQQPNPENLENLENPQNPDSPEGVWG
jgi:hypothetical protein